MNLVKEKRLRENNKPRALHLDAMQGASEERNEAYSDTVNEYRSWQRCSAPRAAGAVGFAGWQGGGAECVNE